MTGTMTDDKSLKFLHIGDGTGRRAIAVRAAPGASPGLVWLGGYKSDMKGTKALALADWASSKGRACLRFDYSGHGESEGAFTDGTIGRWLAESLDGVRCLLPRAADFDRLVDGRLAGAAFDPRIAAAAAPSLPSPASGRG